LDHLSSDQSLGGRIERRLPIIVVVRLAPVERAGAVAEEKTCTDNISAHGARLFSKHRWQPGDCITVTATNEEKASGKVVYCQWLADDRFSVGVTFQNDPVGWSVIRRYDGHSNDPSVTPKSKIPR